MQRSPLQSLHVTRLLDQIFKFSKDQCKHNHKSTIQKQTKLQVALISSSLKCWLVILLITQTLVGTSFCDLYKLVMYLLSTFPLLRYIFLKKTKKHSGVIMLRHADDQCGVLITCQKEV